MADRFLRNKPDVRNKNVTANSYQERRIKGRSGFRYDRVDPGGRHDNGYQVNRLVDKIGADRPLWMGVGQSILHHINKEVKDCQGQDLRPDHASKGAYQQQQREQVDAAMQHQPPRLRFRTHQPHGLERVVA